MARTTLALLTAFVVAASALIATGTPVTWSVQGVVRIVGPSYTDEGIEVPPLTGTLTSLGVVAGAPVSATFALDLDAAALSGTVLGCSVAIGSFTEACGTTYPSNVVLAADGSVRTGSYTDSAFVGGVAHFWGIGLNLRVQPGAPSPGSGFPFDPPDLATLLPFVASSSVIFGADGGGTDLLLDRGAGRVQIELTALSRVPEPELVAAVAVGLALALRRWRLVRSG